LLQEYPDLQVVHGVGRANEEQMQKLYTTTLSVPEQSRVQVKGYITEAYLYSGAADVIITRAGATQMAEFAVQGKPCIVVPNPVLAGGHQLKNAKYLQDKHAAVLVTEQELQDNPNVMAARASELLKDSVKRRKLAKNLAAFAHPAAAEQLAALLLEEAVKSQNNHAISKE
jgi:UDP-N-acetylglucosamine--N-acetylmuramyl-(pentapeptide) pyrophosphoryl-undecaprenol N-acetylglucosamine transferase